MTTEQIIIAVAKLDGWELVQDEEDNFLVSIYKDSKYCQTISKETAKTWHESKFNYLTSYDAIIPVIGKQHPEIIAQVIRELWVLHHVDGEENDILVDSTMILSTPKQLSIALLKAAGKWEE